MFTFESQQEPQMKLTWHKSIFKSNIVSQFLIRYAKHLVKG